MGPLSAPPRNGPCPCGSGVKYKKCCLPKDDAARAAPPRGARAIAHGGSRLVVSGDPSSETLDLAAQYFARKDAGVGPAAQIARFSQPLIDAAGDNPVAIQNAMTLGALLWNMAIVDEASGAQALEEVMKKMTLSDEGASALRAIAADMIARHEQMFPELHGPRG